MPDFLIKKGDTVPVLTATITNADGTSANLAGASVRFVMRSMVAVTPAVNAAATITNATAPATVSYTFTATDTAVAGVYMGEWHITLAGGGLMTWPLDGYQEITVEEDLVTATQPGRLVGLGEVRDHLNIPSTDRTHDAELLRMLDGITPVVESITGPVVQRVIQNETYDGGNFFISLRHRPIVSVQSVVEYRGPIPYPLQQVTTPDLGTIYSYMVEPGGRIVRRTVGGGITPFPPGADQVFVSYTAGYSQVPANIRLGALELLRVNYQQTQQGGRPAYGTGSGLSDDYAGYQMLGFFVPNRVRELLAPSRRHPSIA